MKASKLVTFAILGFLGWNYQTAAREHLGVLFDLYPSLQTQLSMSQYSSALRAEFKSTGELPDDIRDFINDNYDSKTGDEPGLDAFGTPYEADMINEDVAEFRSCGPDKACGTKDDLVVRL